MPTAIFTYSLFINDIPQSLLIQHFMSRGVLLLNNTTCNLLHMVHVTLVLFYVSQVKDKNLDSIDDAEIEKNIEFVQDRPFNDIRYSMDSTRLHQLGWTPKVSWEKGINQTSMYFTLRRVRRLGGGGAYLGSPRNILS